MTGVTILELCLSSTSTQSVITCWSVTFVELVLAAALQEDLDHRQSVHPMSGQLLHDTMIFSMHNPFGINFSKDFLEAGGI